MKLTNEYVESLVADGKDQWHPDPGLSGFGLRITPQGTKLWIARKRVGGRLRKFTIGTYPDMSPTAARKAAGPVLDALAAGKDPVAERANRQRAIESTTTTVEKLSERWMTEQVKPKRKPRTAADYERLFVQHINPAVGKIAVRSLSWEQCNALHISMARIPRRANYTIATLKALLNYAEKLKLRPPHSNPCKGIEFYREKAHERFLSEAEIAKAAGAIEAAEHDGKIGPHAAAGLRLCLLTGARAGEITAAEWSHIDWDRRLIRLPDSKINEPRTIHLNDACIDFLKELPRLGRYIVAGRYKDEPHQNLSRAWIIAREFGGLGDVRLHDLRHSYASLAAGKGISLRIIGELLGHRVPATTQRYAHLAKSTVASVNDEIGNALAAAITKGTTPKPDNVVKLKQPRRKRDPVAPR